MEATDNLPLATRPFPQRRPRAVRTTVGKTIRLTDRDIDVFAALSRYRFLRSTYLYCFAGGDSVKRFKERLGDLFHEGFLDRPERQWEFADARYEPAVYELGNKGRRVLAEHGATDRAPRTFLTGGAQRQFAHAVLICEFLASIELAALASERLRFIPWPEILGRASATTQALSMPFSLPTAYGSVVPDGMFGLEYHSDGKRAYRFFALEIDRGTMPIERTSRSQTSYLAKLDAYREFIASGGPRRHLGVPNLLVLSVMTNERRLAETMRRVSERGDRRPFLFKATEPKRLLVPCQTALVEPWQRAALEELSLASP